VAGILCLDFVNTVTWRGDPADPAERLTSYGELLIWAGHAGAVDAVTARRLAGEAERRPDAARAIVGRAVELREAIARLVTGERGGVRDLAIVNAALAFAPARSTLRRRGDGYAWDGEQAGEILETPLYAVAWSAADLLTSERLADVRRCGDARCAWLFLDTSPAGRRRWCSMDECGNRAKARRHYVRTLAAETDG
jgi:predicted RNA-binding Zn ribbon-like protein